MASSTPAPVGVTRVLDVPFASPNGHTLRADLFLPARDGARPAPVIVWLHGGAWRVGDRKLAPDLSRFFAASGFAMISIDYRLTTDALFPAQIEDVRTAIRWVRSIGPEYGLDATRIGLWGSSAGGHLAALAALAPAGLFEPPDRPYAELGSDVHAVVAAYAPVDFLQMDAHRDPDGPPSDDPESLHLPQGLRTAAPNSPESLLVGAPIGTVPERVREANPLTYVRCGAAPFLIVHGLSDTTVPVHQSRLLHDALEAHGNETTLCLVEGLGHGFFNRTHLDDGPPRRMWLHSPQSPVAAERASGVFALVERFFRIHLAPAPRG